MIATLAIRNLVHDRARLAATVLGVGLSIVLVTVQLGLILGFDRTISNVLDRAAVDLWIVPSGTSSFDDGGGLDEGERYRALSVAGVVGVAPMLVGFAEWRRPTGGTLSVILVGADPNVGVLDNRSLISGQPRDLLSPSAVIVDTSYRDDLGVAGVGSDAAIEGQKARVVGLTANIRSFTTAPYVFASLEQARRYFGSAAGRATYLAVTLTPGADADRVQAELKARLDGVEVISPAEFRLRNVLRWLLDTGAGLALLAGAALALVVGSVIVTQILYASVHDHAREYATLRAIGASRWYLRKIILWQAVFSALFGYGFAFLCGLSITSLSAGSATPIVVSAPLLALLLVLTLAMCVASALFAINKVVHVDPMDVLVR